MDNTGVLSAQVVLKPTAAAASQAVMDAFGQAGFAVGNLVANNFSITAPGAVFEKFFRVPVQTLRQSRPGEVSLDALSPQIRDQVSHVVFSAPLDFGPGANF